MYCIISSSPTISSSSIKLDTGEGVEVVAWRLGDAITWVKLWLADAELLAVDSAIFGLRSLRPFDGDRAENLWLCAAGAGSFWDAAAAVVMDATEPVDDLRRPLKEMDSRFLRVVRPLIVDELEPDTCRGTRDVAVAFVDGDARTDWRCPALPLGVCPFSMTPNSLMDESLWAVGDDPREAVTLDVPVPTMTLVRRFAPLPLSVGELVADPRPEIRGIFVGVSLDKADEEFKEEDGGGSLDD